MTGGKYALRRACEAPKPRSAADDPSTYPAAMAPRAPRCGHMIGGKYALRRRNDRPKG